MKKMIAVVALLAVGAVTIAGCAGQPRVQKNSFAIILQAGKDSKDGTARALHALLYATELRDKGYKVVLIFDGAGTQWAEEFSNPDSDSKILPHYKAFAKTGIEEIVCDYCAGAYRVKEKLQEREEPLESGYKGHPSIAKWVDQGYQLIVL